MKHISHKGIIYLLSLFFVLLAACTKGDTGAKDGKISLIGAAEKDIFNSTGYPIDKEPITIKVMARVRALQGPWDDMKIFQFLTEKTNIAFDFDEIPANSWNQRKNLTLASGDLPDVMLGSGSKNGDANIYGPQGIFLNIEPYLAQYMPNLSEIFAKRPFYKRQALAIDDKIYGLPTFNELEQRLTPDDWFINTAWLEKLGLEMPRTTEEYYQVLKAFKTQDPNGNGKQDEIPLSNLGLVSIYGLANLFGSFGWPMTVSSLIIDQSKITFIPATAGYRDGIRYMARLYQEGLLDKEAFTQKKSVFFAKGKEDPEILGSFVFWHDDSIVGLQRAESDYALLLPLEGPGGLRPQWRKNLKTFMRSSNAFVSAQTAYPASILRLMDYMYTPDISWQLTYGSFGQNLAKDADGRIRELPPPEGLGVAEWRWKNAPGGDTLPVFLSEEMWQNFPGNTAIQRKAERFKRLESYLVSNDSYVSNELNFSMDDQNEASSIQTDLTDFVLQHSVDWITGVSDVDAGWEAYIQQLDRIGLQRYLEIKQKSLDAFLQNQ